jgi:hypothetical protein
VVDPGLRELERDPRRALPALVAAVERGRTRSRRRLSVVHVLTGPTDICGDDLDSEWRQDFEGLPEGAWAEGDRRGGLIVHRLADGSAGIRPADAGATRRMFLVPRPARRAADAWVRSEREFCDVEVEVSVRVLEEIHGPGTFGAAMIGWDLTESAEGASFYALSIGREGWALARVEPSGVSLLSGAAAPSFPPGRWQRLVVSQLGSSIALSADGVRFEVLSDPKAPLVSGRVALGAEDASVEFDDLEVTGSALK